MTARMVIVVVVLATSVATPARAQDSWVGSALEAIVGPPAEPDIPYEVPFMSRVPTMGALEDAALTTVSGVAGATLPPMQALPGAHIQSTPPSGLHPAGTPAVWVAQPPQPNRVIPSAIGTSLANWVIQSWIPHVDNPDESPWLAAIEANVRAGASGVVTAGGAILGAAYAGVRINSMTGLSYGVPGLFYGTVSGLVGATAGNIDSLPGRMAYVGAGNAVAALGSIGLSSILVEGVTPLAGWAPAGGVLFGPATATVGATVASTALLAAGLAASYVLANALWADAMAQRAEDQAIQNLWDMTPSSLGNQPLVSARDTPVLGTPPSAIILRAPLPGESVSGPPVADRTDPSNSDCRIRPPSSDAAFSNAPLTGGLNADLSPPCPTDGSALPLIASTGPAQPEAGLNAPAQVSAGQPSINAPSQSTGAWTPPAPYTPPEAAVPPPQAAAPAASPGPWQPPAGLQLPPQAPAARPAEAQQVAAAAPHLPPSGAWQPPAGLALPANQPPAYAPPPAREGHIPAPVQGYSPPAAYVQPAPPPAREGHVAAPARDYTPPVFPAPRIDHAEAERQRIAALEREQAAELERTAASCRQQHGARFIRVVRQGSGYACEHCNPGYVEEGGQCVPTAEQAAANCRQQYGNRFLRVVQSGGGYACQYCNPGYVPAGGQCVPTTQQAVASCRQQYGSLFLRVVRSGNGYACQYCNPGSVPRNGQCVSTQAHQPRHVQPGIDPATAAAIGSLIGGVIRGIQGHSPHAGRTHAPPTPHYAPRGGGSHQSGGVIRDAPR